MSDSVSMYETYLKNMIKYECANVAFMDCKYREIAYIKCMNQSNENTRYCNYMSDILQICCNNPSMTPSIIQQSTTTTTTNFTQPGSK